MNALALLAGVLTVWVVIAVVGVAMWLLVDFVAGSAEAFVDDWERENIGGERR